MNDLQIFKNEEFGEIRTINEDGKMLFCGADIAKALGYAKPQNAISAHCKGALKRGTPTNGGEQELLFIPEGDVYRLIAHSKLPGAERFEAWVFDEVLPSIRKHGAYMTQDTLDRMIASPEFGIKLLSALKEEQEKSKALEIANSALTVENQIMQPKADYFDQIVDRNLLTNFRETAKQLGAKPKAFVNFLLERKYIYRDKRGHLMPYAQYADAGLFEIKEQVNDKTKWAGTQTLITPKGRETFRLLVP